jgi:hypothetical protein
LCKTLDLFSLKKPHLTRGMMGDDDDRGWSRPQEEEKEREKKRVVFVLQ